MVTHIRLVAAVAAGLMFASSAVIGDETKPPPAATSQPAKRSVDSENPSCLTHTGSRIGAKGKCRGTGRSYTSEDIKRTGATTVAGALPLLDPSITVHH